MKAKAKPSQKRNAQKARWPGEVADGRRNLVLVHTPRAQDRADFEEIKALVERRAADIIVTIVDNEFPFPGIEAELAKRPSLIFSPLALARFAPLRGRGYLGHDIDKMVQQQLLVKAGLPFPPSTVLAPATRLDPAVYGSHVILKPLHGHQSYGMGVQLMRTERVRYIAPRDYPADHPGRETPMIVQRFIDTGPHVASYRVLTFFGAPILAFRGSRVVARAPLEASDELIETSPVASNGGERRFEMIDEPDALALAAKVHDAAPGVALKGTDLLRDREGRLWVIEFNARGNTWAFSSEIGARLRLGLGAITAKPGDDVTAIGRAAMRSQFGAFEKIADILTVRTRMEAN